jgi:hypothetical protein
MFRTRVIGPIFVTALTFSAAAAAVVVRVAPPAAVVETRGASPGASAWGIGFR